MFALRRSMLVSAWRFILSPQRVIIKELPDGLIDVSLCSPHVAHTFQFDVLHFVPFSFVLVPILSRDPDRKQPVLSAVNNEHREFSGGANAVQRLQPQRPGMRRHS